MPPLSSGDERPRTPWSNYISGLALEPLGILPEELLELARKRTDWASQKKLLPLPLGKAEEDE